MEVNNDDGFTVVETLVALTVLAIASIMIARTISTASMQLTAADRLVDAVSLGKRLLAETEVRSAEIPEGFDKASGLGWRRSTDVIPPSSLQASGTLVVVRIQVFQEKTSPAILTLQTVKSGTSPR